MLLLGFQHYFSVVNSCVEEKTSCTSSSSSSLPSCPTGSSTPLPNGHGEACQCSTGVGSVLLEDVDLWSQCDTLWPGYTVIWWPPWPVSLTALHLLKSQTHFLSSTGTVWRTLPYTGRTGWDDGESHHHWDGGHPAGERLSWAAAHAHKGDAGVWRPAWLGSSTT